ncbi:MAG TPA: phage portal protein, partial [Lachnospira sp.]|nr:phage portal protein [Lachnospira sp.]
MLFVLKQYEEEVDYKLLTELEIKAGKYFRQNEKALLRTDSKTQMEILKEAVNNGLETVNEARRKLDLEDMEGGDVLIVNGTYVKLTDVGAAYKKGLQQEDNEQT